MRDASTLSETLPRRSQTGSTSVGSLPDSVGQTWLGQYRIDGVLGEGGMARVLAAYDIKLGRDVALKLLRPGVPGSVTALTAEARALAAVRHPNIVAIHALHPEAEPPFFVMERVDGRTLEVELAAEGQLPLAVALDVIEDVARGLDCLHAHGLVHGDVKPSNVLLTPEGTAKLADLGLASFLETCEPGELVGTPCYMPPERAHGEKVDPAYRARGDVYSFAVMAFQLLTGRLPFRHETTLPMVHAHAFEPPPRPSDISTLAAAFDAPLLSALRKHPHERTRSAGELAAELRKAAACAEVDGQPFCFLIVDDDQDARELLSQALEEHFLGSPIHSAGDGLAALALAREVMPTVAIVDLQMPGLDGIGLTRELRDISPPGDLAIIVLTGEGNGRDWAQLLDAGADRFLVKPSTIDALKSAIRDLRGTTFDPRA